MSSTVFLGGLRQKFVCWILKAYVVQWIQATLTLVFFPSLGYQKHSKQES